MKLLLDVGNTRLKWAYARDRQLLDSGAAGHDGKPADLLARLDLDEPDTIEIASVAGTVNDLALSKLCVARWMLNPQFIRVEASYRGLVNGYAEPLRLGVDRWLAMLGAWVEMQDACLVVDAGTALTVDAIAADGRHLGGIIAAGVATSAGAVLGATRFPTRTVPPQADAGLGLDTESCVRQGALLSVLGAVDRVAALLPGARGYLCGGDGALLLPHLPGRWLLRPHLVMEGMLARPGD